MYVFHIIYKIRENVLQIDATIIKAVVASKIKNFVFCRENNKSFMKILKSEGRNMYNCRVPLTISLQSLTVETILILCVRFVR